MKLPNLEFLDKYTLKELRSARGILILLIIADVFGVYWYLGWVKFGLALLLVLIFGLVGVLALESRQKADKIIEHYVNKQKEVKTMEEGEETKDKDLDLGLPDAEEYEDRLMKQFEI